MERKKQLAHISRLCLHNANSLMQALHFCHRHGIGAFRVNSQILPLKTHPDVGYHLEELPKYQEIIDAFRNCGEFCLQKGLRTTFHPDQFVLLSSPHQKVTQNSLSELQYQAQVAEWILADVINIHGGGGYGNKAEALRRLVLQIEKLSDSVRSRLTLENDDRVYTPQDLLPVCRLTQVPLVYDVHHHRCLPDGLSVESASELALTTWNREPVFHVSSPINGWNGETVHKHHDFIDPKDVPECWRNLNVTVEVEAKAKELAVLELKKHLEGTHSSFFGT